MSTSYYPVSAIIDGSQIYFLWYTNGTDGVLCDGANVRAFRSLDDCLHFARNQRWTVDETVTVYDFDSVSNWLQHYQDAPIDPIMLLNAWNLTEDFMRSVSASDAQFALTGHRVYDKLFAANNLPAMEAASGGFVAEWNDEDRAEIASQLSLPFNMFRQSILVE